MLVLLVMASVTYHPLLGCCFLLCCRYRSNSVTSSRAPNLCTLSQNMGLTNFERNVDLDGKLEKAIQVVEQEGYELKPLRKYAFCHALCVYHAALTTPDNHSADTSN